MYGRGFARRQLLTGSREALSNKDKKNKRIPISKGNSCMVEVITSSRKRSDCKLINEVSPLRPIYVGDSEMVIHCEMLQLDRVWKQRNRY